MCRKLQPDLRDSPLQCFPQTIHFGLWLPSILIEHVEMPFESVHFSELQVFIKRVNLSIAEMQSFPHQRMAQSGAVCHSFRDCCKPRRELARSSRLALLDCNSLWI